MVRTRWGGVKLWPQSGLQAVLTGKSGRASIRRLQDSQHVGSWGRTHGREGKAVAAVTDVTDEDFGTAVEAHQGLVLVDFGAEYCGPCRALDPTIEVLAQDYEGRVKVCKVDIDQGNQAAVRYGIQPIPAILLFRDGKVVEQMTGAINKKKLVEMLDKHVA